MAPTNERRKVNCNILIWPHTMLSAVFQVNGPVFMTQNGFEKKIKKRTLRERERESERERERGRERENASRCFEPSQSLRIISGLKTNFNPSLSYSAYKSLNINHNFSTN